MRFTTALVALLSTAHGLSLFRGDEAVIADDENKIPGDSPLELCAGKEHKDDILTIERVDLSPNPPEAGKDLIIKAVGTLSEDVEEGSYVLLQVKYGLIRLINTKADLCEQTKNVDVECPIKEGKLELTKTVELPAQIPPGKYTVVADVYTKDDKPVTCLEAKVAFSRGGSMLEL